MNTMNRSTTLTLIAMTLLWLGVVMPAGKAVGQQAGSRAFAAGEDVKIAS
jgi:hypothetical protein